MIAATVKRYWDFVAGHVFGTGRLPEPQTRPNWIVTQADLDEAAGVDPDARYAVPFQVAGRAILSETPVLTPRQILRAAGRDPDSPDDTAGVVLVRLDNDHAREVYAPLAFDAELTVAAGDRFAVWAGDDTRLHWYTVNGLRQVSLFYALPPTVVLRNAGYDSARYALCVNREPQLPSYPSSDRRPVRVSGAVFGAVPRPMPVR